LFIDHKPFLYIWRPTYRLLLAAREFFTRDIGATQATIIDSQQHCVQRIRELEASTAEANSQIRQLIGELSAQSREINQLMQRIRTLEGAAEGQWTSVEKLLLCTLSEPTAPGSDWSRLSADSTHEPAVKTGSV
jgi:uncharacterized coiled-coil protein SlyX